MKNAIIVVILLLQTVMAAEDSYHTALLQQLESEHNITGGEWVLSDNEITTLGYVDAYEVTPVVLNHSGAEPFTRILDIDVKVRYEHAYQVAFRFPIQQPVSEGDVLLLVTWVRGISGETGYCMLDQLFEKAGSPYTKSLFRGQFLDEQWRQCIFPFTAVENYAAGEARIQFNVGHQFQHLQFAGPALINYQSRYTPEQLPRTDWDRSYEGRDISAAWRAEAQDRILQYRTGPVRVHVVDADGMPLSGAQVDVNMKQHAFGFGTAISAAKMRDSGPDGATYVEKLENLNGDGKTFNIVVYEYEMKWPIWENPDAGSTKEEIAASIAWFKNRGIDVRGHCAVWPAWDNLPDDLYSHRHDPDYVRNRIEAHIDDIFTYPGILGELQEWDVVNEAAHLNDLRDLFGGDDIYADIYKLAFAADPNQKQFLNEYDVLNQGGYLGVIERFKELVMNIRTGGGRVDGLGLQGHFDYPLTPPERIYDILEELRPFADDLAITEYDAVGIEDDVAADFMRDLLTIVFSHPSCKSFIMWGFWDDYHWKNDAPLFYSDWSLKPSGQAFLNQVFNEWWTDEQGLTDVNGQYHTTGYYGNYEITAEYDGIQKVVQYEHSKDSGEIVIELGDDHLTYYVDANNGNDAWDGLYLWPQGDNKGPLRTIGEANARVGAGDKVLIRAGTYAQGVDPSASGAPGQMIEYRPYANEQVIITGAGVTGVDLSQKMYIRVNGLEIRNVDYFVELENGHYHIVENCSFINADRYSGAYVRNSTYNQFLNNSFSSDPDNTNCGDLLKLVSNDSGNPIQRDQGQVGADYNLIEGNFFGAAGHAGLTVRGKYNVIRNNVIENPDQKGVDISWQIDSGWAQGDGEFNLFEHNIVKFCGADFRFSGLVLAGPNNITRFNELYGNVGDGIEVSIWDGSDDAPFADRNAIYHNVIFDNDTSTYANSKWQYNNGIAFNNWYPGNTIEHTRILNNILYKNHEPQIQGDYDPATTIIGANQQLSDPLFVDADGKDFNLSNTSPYIDAGDPLATADGNGTGAVIKLQSDESYLFSDGYGIVDGDTIWVNGQTAVIMDINYDTDALTLDRTVTWADGDAVTFPYSGTAPDCGAYEVKSVGVSVSLDINVWLEGVYDTDTHQMTTTLLDSGVIPLNSPYSQAPAVVLAVPADVTDWVLVQLHAADDLSVVAVQSAFLRKDGKIIGAAGESKLDFTGFSPGDYHIAVLHRNHCAVMSAEALLLETGLVSFDFTDHSPQTPKIFGTKGATQLEPGVWGLWSGDVNQDGNITSLDYTTWYNAALYEETGYRAADLNFDGQVTTADYMLWFINARAAAASQVPHH